MNILIKSLGIAMLLSGSVYGQWVTGYYSAQNGVESISNIPWNKYTHIIHFAAAPGVDGSGNGNGTVSLNYLTQAEINQINSSKPAGKKVLVCIKDSGSNTNAFAQDTAPGMVSTFVSNIVNFVNQNGYDGVDIDWEAGVNVTQYQNFLGLLKNAMPNKLVTIASGNWGNLPQVAAAAYPSIDQLNVMCYDMDNTGGAYSWYNDALLQNGDSSKMTCDWRVNAFTSVGVPAAKIGVGIPFYGRRHTGTSTPLTAGGSSQFTVFYRDLVTDPSRWQSSYMQYDSNYRADYLSIPALNEFVSYNGTKSISDTVAWQKSQGFGGFMTFAMEYEYLGSQSGDARYPLSSALYNDVFGASSTQPTQPTQPPSAPVTADAGPVLSAGSPSGTLPASTTTATLSLATNVNAYCAYSTTAGTPFSSMPYAFSITGGTEHSTTVSNLTPGTTYSYYVKCSDAAQVASAQDYLISFSTAAAASTLSSTKPSATVSPNTGTGLSAVFAVSAVDNNGANAIQQVNLMVGSGSAVQSCYIQYWAPTNTLFLQNDAGSGWTQALLGNPSILRNSKCSLDVRSTTISRSGTTLLLKLPVTFAASFAGGKTVNTFVADTKANSGWQQGGTWIVK